MVETSSPPTGLILKRCPSSPIIETQLHSHQQHQLRQQHLSSNTSSSGNVNILFTSNTSNNNSNSNTIYNNNNNSNINSHPSVRNMPANCQRPPTPPSPSSTYHLTTAMLLNSQQCGYLGQRLQTVLQQKMQSQTPTSSDEGSLSGVTILEDDRSSQTNNTNAAVAAAASLFTIDSILGSRTVNNAVSAASQAHNTNCSAAGTALTVESGAIGAISNSQQKRAESPASLSSNSSSTATSPLRPQRTISSAAVLQHPGLHLGHLAAAAATGFAASPSDFLGK